MNDFFQELKRRKVYRVAVGYIVAAGGVIQLASAVFPAWDLPSWALRLTIVLLLIGFPFALLLAWAFDITTEGIRATPALAPDSRAGVVPGHRKRNIFLLGVLGLVISAAAGFFLLPRADAFRMEKSIAVLPFQNFSNDPENAFFADGIQDDILTNLSKIRELKVISRTSVMAYRGSTKSVRQIGKELGVSALLEGSVRREGNRVRVNVQLINAENDEHLWAEDYDRELTDVFAIQTDLSQKIARELQAQLSPSEKAQIMQRPTENGEAYLAFVEAHNLSVALEDFGKLKQAVQLYERAIQLDPNFVLAVANLSILHSWIYHNFEATPAELELARRYAERALALRPGLALAHLAQGYFLYYGKRDYDGALRELAIAQASLPNESHVYLVIGAIQRRQGKWKESTANLEKAVSLNPNDPWPLQNLFFNYAMQRDFAAANRILDKGLKVDPGSFSLWSLKAKIAATARGDLTVAEKGLAAFQEEMKKSGGQPPKNQKPEVAREFVLAKANVAFFQRKYAEALAALGGLPPGPPGGKAHGMIDALLMEGTAHEKLGQTTEARAAFLKAREAAEAALRQSPNEPSLHAMRARCLAHLGEKEAAIAEAKRATALLPESVDAFEGPGMTAALAEVYALSGEKAKAIELLDGLLGRPGDLTVPLLKLDPSWDSLRGDPAFEQMLARHQPVA